MLCFCFFTKFDKNSFIIKALSNFLSLKECCILLRSGKPATKEYIPRRRNRRMANQPSSGEMPPPIPGNGITVIPTVSEPMPSKVGSTPALTVTQTGPILFYIGPRVHQEHPHQGEI